LLAAGCVLVLVVAPVAVAGMVLAVVLWRRR
jgi:hypothetical protein